MQGVLVDEQDDDAMYEAMTQVVDRTRHGEGLALNESLTYRSEYLTAVSNITFLPAQPCLRPVRRAMR
jgi:TPP-dependent pyruvate/acetoin dehydrogenase alpha subunit